MTTIVTGKIILMEADDATAQDSRFYRYLMQRLRESEGSRTLILSDVRLDFPKVDHPREALIGLMVARPIFFSGLRRWIGAGGRLIWIESEAVGDPGIRELLREVLPNLIIKPLVDLDDSLRRDFFEIQSRDSCREHAPIGS